MAFSQRWQSRTALSLAIALSTTASIPFLFAKAAAADPYTTVQQFPPTWRTALPAGTVIPVRYDKEKIILTPGETVPVTLTVDRNINSAQGTVLIPEGSEIEGKLKPAGDGTQFVAETLITSNGYRMPIDATSDVITRRETISKRSNPDLLKGAAIGGAAAAVLSEIFGDIDILEVLGGAGLGALASVLLRGREDVEVITVVPTTDLALTLESDFAVSQR